MARGGVIGGIVVLAAAAAAVWFFVGSSPTAPVVDGEGADEAAAVVADPALAAGGKRPAAVVGAPAGALRGTILGRVIRADGSAVAGVRVVATSPGGRWDERGSVEPSQRGVRETEALRAAFASVDDPKPGDPDLPRAATGETGPDGRFTLKVEGAGNYAVEAYPAPPLCRGRANAQLMRDRTETTVVIVVVEGGALRGKVVDAADRPMAAVVLGAWTAGERGGSVPAVATDPTTGAFTLEGVPPGRAFLTVRVAGRGEWTVKTPVPAPDPFVIRVPSGGVVVGRVTDGTGAPVADVDLLVATGLREAPPAGMNGSRGRGKSAADGSFRIEGLFPGRVTTVSMLPPGRPARTEAVGRARWTGAEVRDGAETRLDLVLVRGGVVAGRVTEAGTKAAVADAEVLLFARPSGGMMMNVEAVRVKVDATGAYRFEDVPFGRYAVMPTSAKHYFAPAVARNGPMMWDGSGQGMDAPWVVVSAEGEVVERDVELTPGLVVVGSVKGPDGAPVAGAEVRAANASPLYQGAWNWGVNMTLGNQPLATTDEGGAFRIANLPPTNDLTLYAAKAPLLGAATERLKLEAGGPPPPPVLLTLAAGATVAGRVVDADGKPLAAWMVNWWSQDPKAPGWGNTTSDEEGRFRVEGLPATGIVLSAQPTSGRRGGANQRLDPPLSPGEVREGVELKPGKFAYLRGVAVDEAGKPAAGVNLFFQGESPQTTTTDEDGTFDVALPAGTYEVGMRMASGWGLDGPSISATAPAEGLRITVKPSEKTYTVIGGRVVAADGTRIPACTVSIKAEGNPNALNDEVIGGEFRREMTGKPPFTVVASVPRGTRGELLNLKSNKVVVEKDTLDVVLTLEKGLVVKGRVLTPSGEPAPGATVRAGPISASTDATGAFVLPGFASGDPVPLTVQPPATYVAPNGVTARPGGEDVIVRLVAGGSVAGRVVGLEDAKGIQAWVYVMNGGHSIAVGADGTFKLEGLPATGTVDLALNTWDGSGKASPFVGVTMKGVPIGSDGVVMTVTRGVHIRGVVVDQDGAPASNLQLQVTGEGGEGSGGQSDATGAFVIGAVRPGSYTLTVHRPNGGIALKDVKVEAPSDGVRLVVPRGRKVSGRVLGAGGKQVNLSVVTQGAKGTEQVGWGQCGSDGRFSIDVTGDGPFRVNAMADDRYGRADRVVPGTDVEIPLAVGLEISGVVEPEARSATGTWVMAEGDGWSGGAPCDTEGAFRVRGLPPGRYTLKVFKQEASAPPTEGTPVDAGATNVRLR
ncbi:MAG: carboxypeptidase regulatory-like domain-containing protein [Planctomycetota bacterium]